MGLGRLLARIAVCTPKEWRGDIQGFREVLPIPDPQSGRVKIGETPLPNYLEPTLASVPHKTTNLMEVGAKRKCIFIDGR